MQKLAWEPSFCSLVTHTFTLQGSKRDSTWSYMSLTTCNPWSTGLILWMTYADKESGVCNLSSKEGKGSSSDLVLPSWKQNFLLHWISEEPQVQAAMSIKIWSTWQPQSLGTVCKHILKTTNAPFTATFTKGECPAPLKRSFEPWSPDLGQERNKSTAPVSFAVCPRYISLRAPHLITVSRAKYWRK